MYSDGINMVEQVNPKAKYGQAGYSAALSGGVLITDQSGNVVDQAPYGTEAARAAVDNKPLYKTADGYTTKIPDIYADFDASGNIVIHAPKEVINMSSFQKNVLENSSIKQLSAAYKVDPNYSFPDPEDDSKTTNIEEQLKKLNEGLAQYRDSAQQLIDERDKLVRTPREGLSYEERQKFRDLSLDDMVTALTFAANGNDRQAIPNYLVDLFSTFETWDADSQTVSKDELLKKWWSYDTSTRGELITKWLRNKNEIIYSDSINPEADDVTSLEHHLADPTDIARALSLEKFLEANEASANDTTGVARKVQNVVTSEILSVVGAFTSGILSATATASSLFGLVKSPVNVLAAKTAGDIEKSVKQMNDEVEVFDKTAAAVGTVMETLGNIGAILVADVAVGDVADLAFSSLDKVDDAAGALKAVSDNGKNIAKGADFVFKTVPSKVAGEIIHQSINMLRRGEGLVRFLGEVMVEAAVDNPQVMADFMSDKAQPEEMKQALMEEAAYNGLGLAVGLTVSKGLAGFSQTKVGRAMNSALSVINAKVSTKAGDAFYNLRSTIAKAPLEDALAEKAEKALDKGNFNKAYKYRKAQQTITAQNQLRDARKVLANMSIRDTDAIVEQIGKIQAMDAAYDLAANGSKRMYSAITASDPIIRASNEATQKSFDDVISAQKKAGLTAAKSAKYGSSGMSEVASQYVSLTHRIHIAEIASEIPSSSLYKNAKEALPVYQKQMEELLKDITPELKIALDDYISNLKGFYRDITDWAVAEGLLSEETIQSYRVNPLFENDNYMRVMVEQDADKIRMMRADGLISEDNLLDIKNLSLPAEAQKFVDPEITRTWYGLEIAKSYNAQNLAKAALEATGATPTVMASNAEIKVARDVTANAKEVSKAAKEYYGSLVSEIDASITLKQLGELSETQKTYLGSLSKQKAAERKINVAYKKAAVQNFSDEELSAVLKEGGYKSGSAYDDLQVQLGEGGKKAYDAWYSDAPDSMKQWLKEQRNVELGAKLDETKGGAKVTFRQFSSLQKDVNFGKGFDQQTVFASKKMMGSKKVVSASKKVTDSTDFLEDLTASKKTLKKAKTDTTKAKKVYEENLEIIKDDLREAIDNYVDRVAKDNKVIASTKAISDYGQGDPETIAKYLALRELKKGKNLDSIKKAVEEKVRKGLPKKTTEKEIEEYEKAVDWAIDSLVNEEFNNSRLALDSINSKIIDKKEWADEIRTLHKKISDAQNLPNVIKVSDGNGGIQLIEVNPNLAFLYNYRPRRVARDRFWDKMFRGSSKLYRFGQTTFSSKSFVMQAFRDSGNAYFMGNAWRDISSSADNLVDVFGKNIVEEIKNFEPAYYEKLVKQVADSGAEVTTETLAKAEVSNIQAFGREISPASTSTELYSQMGRDELFDKMRSGVGSFTDKLDNIFNGKRENYLRNRVFMNALNDAMGQGHTYKESKAIAIQMMNNATTNFSRSIYYLDSLSENVPYIKSAINGTTSFWRMYSLDPVGVMGRLTGGLFVPYTYLIGQSLSDPENAEIYANIPEYEKRDNLVIVVRGQKFSIPIPQELASIVAPFRHFVEYLYGAQKNNFWDLLGLSPVDLTGFSNVDMNLMTSDPTIWDRLNRGTMRLISQLAPVPVKAAWIMGTQIDPYTGKRIANTHWTYYDPETGEEIPMGYNQGAFAERLAKVLNNDNPALVSKVVSSMFGTTGEDVLDALAGMVSVGDLKGEDPLQSLTHNLVLPQFENMTRSLYEETYDYTNSLWRQAIRNLEVEKQQITESENWKKVNSAMSQTKDAAALQKLRAQRQDMIDEFNQKVVDTAKRLQSVYGGTLDRTRLASVVQLLNFSTNTDFDLSNQYLRDLSSEVYYAGSNQATRTMYELGVRGTTDYSIFGYFKRNADGSVGIKYTKPTAIIDMGNVVYGAKDIESANLKNILDEAGITRGKMFSDEYYAAKASAEKKAYKANWNKQVLRALAPYINSVGVDEIVNNTEISDYLDQYIFVDNPYKAKDYIKKLFKGE